MKLTINGIETEVQPEPGQVLRTLLDHPKRALSRDFLLNTVYGKEAMPFDRSIDVCISRLRQQLADNPRSLSLIRTVRNTGYMLMADVAYDA